MEGHEDAAKQAHGKAGGKKELEAKLAEKDKEIADLRSRMRYLQADFENYCKHIEKEKGEFEKLANERLVRHLLPFIDDLERSVAKAQDEATRAGLAMLLKNLMGVLDVHGVKRVDALGGKFDPYLHEVVIAEKSEKEDGTVLEELQPGYTLGGRVLRHSKVRIANNH